MASIQTILTKMTGIAATNKDLKEDLARNSTVLLFNKKELHAFVLVQLYLMVFPVSKGRHEKSLEENIWATEEELQAISGQALNAEVNIIGTEDRKSIVPGTNAPGQINTDIVGTYGKVINPDAKMALEKAVDQAHSNMVAAATKLAANTYNVFSKGGNTSSASVTRIDEISKYSSDSNTVGFRIENNGRFRGNLYDFAKARIFDKGTIVITDYFHEALVKAKKDVARAELFKTKNERTGYDKLSKEEQKALPNRFALLDVGHIYASGNQLIALVQRTKEIAKEITDPTERAKFVAKTRGILKSKVERNLVDRVAWNLTATIQENIEIVLDRLLEGEIEIVLSLESTAANRGIFVDIENQTRASIEAEIVKYLLSKDQKLLNMTSSPSILQTLVDNTVDNIVYRIDNTGKKRRPKKVSKIDNDLSKSTKINSSKKVTTKLAGTAKGKVPKQVRSKALGEPVNQVTLNLVNIQAIINDHLPIYLKKNMGKGTARETLNWRTGRFANSAQLKTLVEAKGSRGTVLRGTLDFMRHPYDTFMPGGKLYKPGRDPQKLINKSIRQILKDKALAALSFTSRV